MNSFSTLKIGALAGRLAVVVICIFLALLMLSAQLSAQDTPQPRKKGFVAADAMDTLRADSAKIIEDAPLDIAQDRGLFIVTPDQKMQLRILGSVRYFVIFDEIEMTSKNAFNTHEIPTGEMNRPLFNYYNSLGQTRLGFEVTRRTGGKTMFIRLETDFAGPAGFRIRHAYGQYGRFLFGQTWSLFSHITALPATVSFGGPTGAVVVRTPQVRYSPAKFLAGANLAVGLEYALPELKIPDSLRIEPFQLIPNLTARIDKTLGWGSFQLSGIIPMLSGRSNNGDLIFKPGWGVSASVLVNSWARGTWYLQGVGGQAITHFFTDLGGQGLDILFDPESSESAAPLALGFYASYEHAWRSNLSSNFTYGLVRLEEISFVPGGTFQRGHTFRINTFWDFVEGGKIGCELIWGQRVNKDEEKGNALRGSLLFYYDF